MNRQEEKEASRKEDARRLAAGEVTREDLKKENSFFRALDFSKWEIVAIGGKPIKKD